MPNKRFDTDSPIRLRVQIAGGNVDIVTHDEPITEVDVTCPDDPAFAERVTIEHSNRRSDPTVVVVAPREHGLFDRLGRSHDLLVSVRLPAESMLAIDTASADIEARGQFGWASITTASGDAEVDDVHGDLLWRAASGDLTVGNVDGQLTAKTASGRVDGGDVSGDVQVGTASGDLRLRSVAGGLSAKTASGDVSVQRCADARVQTASGDVRLESVGAGKVAAKTVSGNVSVAVPTGTLVRVDAQSLTGQLSSQIDLDGDRPEGFSSSDLPRIEVSARTVSGDVTIRRAAASDAA